MQKSFFFKAAEISGKGLSQQESEAYCSLVLHNMANN